MALALSVIALALVWRRRGACTLRCDGEPHALAAGHALRVEDDGHSIIDRRMADALTAATPGWASTKVR